jgi:hypothetical protein
MPVKVLFLGAVFLLLVSCAKKGVIPGDPENQRVELPRLGVSLDIPPGFNLLGGEELKALLPDSPTTLELEPFTVSPLYGFAGEDGKGTLIVSALEFSEAGRGDPLSAVDAYQRNLEDFFKAGRISFEEIPGKDGGLLLMAMSFGEGEEETVLFKGLYHSPEQFFMLDLYIRPTVTREEDAQNYRTMFLSLVP